MKMPRPSSAAPRSCALLFRSCPSLFLAMGKVHCWADFSGRGLHALAFIVLPAVLPAMFLLRSTRKGIYNILWALVFGFATLNILSLGARRFDPDRSRLSFGETIAIMVVIVSIVLLGWEMLNLFKVFPIKLRPHNL